MAPWRLRNNNTNYYIFVLLPYLPVICPYFVFGLWRAFSNGGWGLKNTFIIVITWYNQLEGKGWILWLRNSGCSSIRITLSRETALMIFLKPCKNVWNAQIMKSVHNRVLNKISVPHKLDRVHCKIACLNFNLIFMEF